MIPNVSGAFVVKLCLQNGLPPSTVISSAAEGFESGIIKELSFHSSFYLATFYRNFLQLEQRRTNAVEIEQCRISWIKKQSLFLGSVLGLSVHAFSVIPYEKQRNATQRKSKPKSFFPAFSKSSRWTLNL